jgi:hypothetical protein
VKRPAPDREPEHDGATLSLAPWKDVLPGPDAQPSLWTGTDLLQDATPAPRPTTKETP